MAKIYLNGSKSHIDELPVPERYTNTKIKVTVKVVPAESGIIKIAGYSVIDCKLNTPPGNNGILKTMFVNFTDEPLTHALKMFGEVLEVEANVSKIKDVSSAKNGSKIPVTCKLEVEAGDDLLKEYELSDRDNPVANPVFIFRIMLNPQTAADEI
jgi:hypothetical protein